MTIALEALAMVLGTGVPELVDTGTLGTCRLPHIASSSNQVNTHLFWILRSVPDW
jgi:hypothetical protein